MKRIRDHFHPTPIALERVLRVDPVPRRIRSGAACVVLALVFGGVGAGAAHGDGLTLDERHAVTARDAGATLSDHQHHVLHVLHLVALRNQGVRLTPDELQTLANYRLEQENAEAESEADRTAATEAQDRAAATEAHRVHLIAENRDRMAEAGKYAVETGSGLPLLVRLAPRTDATKVGSIASGHSVSVSCQVPDGGVYDAGSTVWAKIGEAPDRFVAAAPYLSRWSTFPTTEVCSEDEWTPQEQREQDEIDRPSPPPSPPVPAPPLPPAEPSPLDMVTIESMEPFDCQLLWGSDVLKVLACMAMSEQILRDMVMSCVKELANAAAVEAAIAITTLGTGAAPALTITVPWGAVNCVVGVLDIDYDKYRVVPLTP